jgi:hypothetical protein
MNVMRVAIAGKDEERFPGDEQTGQKLKAAVEAPAKLANPPKAGLPARPVNVHPAVKPGTTPAVPAPGAKPAKPSSEKPLVKPALPPQAPPAKPNAVIKPALDAEPDKPRNRQ